MGEVIQFRQALPRLDALEVYDALPAKCRRCPVSLSMIATILYDLKSQSVALEAVRDIGLHCTGNTDPNNQLLRIVTEDELQDRPFESKGPRQYPEQNSEAEIAHCPYAQYVDSLPDDF